MNANKRKFKKISTVGCAARTEIQSQVVSSWCARRTLQPTKYIKNVFNSRLFAFISGKIIPTKKAAPRSIQGAAFLSIAQVLLDEQ